MSERKPLSLQTLDNQAQLIQILNNRISVLESENADLKAKIAKLPQEKPVLEVAAQMKQQIDQQQKKKSDF